MNKKRQTIDGFIPRRQSGRNLAPSQKKAKTTKPAIEKKKIVSKKNPVKEKRIDEVLDIIEIEAEKPRISGERPRRRRDRVEMASPHLEKKLKKFNSKREKKGKKPFSMERFLRRRKTRRFVGSLALVFVLVFGLRFGPLIGSILSNIGRMTDGGSFFDLIKTEKLKQDDSGRSNILIFGTSPEGWEGEDLADSIMVLSANQETGKAYTVSLPRDLWVKHNCPYMLGTNSGKLNESYYCGKFSQGDFNPKTASEDQKKQAEKLGQQELASAVEKILGLKIHYTVHANWQVLVQAIDAIGGIDVKVEVWDGSPYMYDVATKVRYKNGETVHMTGQQALDFSRARGSAGGVGLSGGNFDRERNQQKVLKSTIEKINREKFNFDALVKIADSLGDNIKTDFNFAEMRAGLDLAMKSSGDKVKSLPLVDSEGGASLLTTDMIGSASAVVPSAGLYDYSEIQKFIAKNTKTGDFISEDARIIILNGTEITGLAGKKKQELEADGFNIVQIGDFAKKGLTEHEIYSINSEKTATAKKLEEKFGVKISSSDQSVEKFRQMADFVVILGEK